MYFLTAGIYYPLIVAEATRDWDPEPGQWEFICGAKL